MDITPDFGSGVVGSSPAEGTVVINNFMLGSDVMCDMMVVHASIN